MSAEHRIYFVLLKFQPKGGEKSENIFQKSLRFHFWNIRKENKTRGAIQKWKYIFLL